MMKRIFKTGILTLGFLLILGLTQGFSQDDFMTSFVSYTPQFFVCIVSGVLLALAFQIVLTMVSIAAGISVTGNLEDLSRKDPDKKKTETLEKSKTPDGVKVSIGIGIWAVVTAGISLFLASFLAVQMVDIPEESLGFTLGLVIWASFFIVMMYLEIKTMSSVLGGMFTTAVTGIRSSFASIQELFSTGTHKTEIPQTLDNIKKELYSSIDTSDLDRKIQKYISTLQVRTTDYTHLKKEMSDLLEDIELDSEYLDKGEVVEIFIHVANSHPSLSRELSRKLIAIARELKSDFSSERSEADKLLRAFDMLTPVSEGEAQKFQEKFESYLIRTKKEELKPEKLKTDFEAMMRDPLGSREVMNRKIGMLNKSTVASLLSKRDDMNRDETNKIATYVESAIDFIRGKLSGGGGRSGGGGSEGKDRTDYPSERMREIPENILDNAEDKIRNFLNSINREEFNYEKIKLDFQKMFSDPQAAMDILQNRLSLYNRDSLVALISTNPRVSEEDANRIVSKIEEAKDSVIRKAKELEEEARRRLEIAKQKALQKAEKGRKIAAAAAWWLIAAAVISAIAAGLGGLAGIT